MHIQETYLAVPEAVPLARDKLTEIATAAGAHDDTLEGVRLAVSEAVGNAVVHAYREAPGTVRVNAAVIGGSLCVDIEDDGCGLSAHRPSEGLGMGLTLMAKTSDGLTLEERMSGGLAVRMRFALVGTAT